MKKNKVFTIFGAFALLLSSCSFLSSKPKALKVIELPVQVNYAVGDIFRSAGLEVVDQDNNKVNDYTLNPSDGYVFKIIGNYEIEVAKQNYESTYFTVKVSAEKDDSKEIELANAKNDAIKELSDYYDTFDLDEYDAEGKANLLEIKNDAIDDIKSAKSVEAVNEILKDAKKKMDEVSKKEFIDHTLVSIRIVGPQKKRYSVGDAIDLKGLKVYAVYDDNLEESVINYQVENVDLIKAGTYNIKVSYKNVNASFTIEVVDKPTYGSTSIDIFATNDMHGQIFEENYRAGIGKAMTYLKEQKKANTLLIDQGDTWQGSIYSNTNHGALINDIMNYIQYDARTIGNHDFDWGKEYISINRNSEYNNYKTPVLGANIYDFDFVSKTTGRTFQSDLADKSVTYTLENGLKVGIVGVIGKQQITTIMSKYVEDITFTDHVEAIKSEATYLRNNGCDIVIASAHTGEEDLLGEGLENYVDLVLCGHTHQSQLNTENGLYYGQFGCYTNEIGHFQLSYDYSTNKVTSTSVSSESGLELRNTITVDKQIQNIIDTHVNAFEESSKEVVAKNVTGYFDKEVTLANVMCNAMYSEALLEGYDVDLTYCNQARYTLNKSTWTYADIYQAFPFENEIYIFEATYDEVMSEIAKYNCCYRSPSFDGKVVRGQKIKVAVLDYLLFHTSSSRYYDYFPDNNGRYIAKLSLKYRDSLKSWLIREGYADNRTLRAGNFATTLTPFSKTFNTDTIKVNFYMNDGTDNLYQSYYINSGDSFNPYLTGAIPTRKDYVFQGWYLDSDCSISASGEVVSETNCSLYAKWGKNGVENKGTLQNPFSVKEAISHIDNYGNDGNVYYVKGIVSGEISISSYGNSVKFVMSDGTDNFTAYYVTYNDDVPKVGDTVIVSGQLTLYLGTIYETLNGTGNLVSIL